MATADPYSRSANDSREPPRGFWATLRHLGPGMILAGSIVGSGELIVTTKLGAVAGFTLLWFVLLSCLVKVVVQAELARHTIASGQTFLRVFNELPGPAGRRPEWLTLPWMTCVLLASVIAVTAFARLGSEVRTAGVACAFIGAVVAVGFGVAKLPQVIQRHLATPRREVGSRPMMNWYTWLWLGTKLLIFVNSGAILGGAGQVVEMVFPGLLGEGGARYWSILLAVICSSILVVGTYASLERMLVILVSSFTVVYAGLPDMWS